MSIICSQVDIWLPSSTNYWASLANMFKWLMIMRMTVNLLRSNGGSDHGMSVSSALLVTCWEVDKGGCVILCFSSNPPTLKTHSRVSLWRPFKNNSTQCDSWGVMSASRFLGFGSYSPTALCQCLSATHNMRSGDGICATSPVPIRLWVNNDREADTQEKEKSWDTGKRRNVCSSPFKHYSKAARNNKLLSVCHFNTAWSAWHGKRKINIGKGVSANFLT